MVGLGQARSGMVGHGRALSGMVGHGRAWSGKVGVPRWGGPNICQFFFKIYTEPVSISKKSFPSRNYPSLKVFENMKFSTTPFFENF